ncbi:MAG: hypothetical protein WC391_08475, partial [Methanoregula sp.]
MVVMKLSAVAALVLVVTLVACCGCVNNPAVIDRSEGTLHAHYAYTDEWSPALGCYERVTGYVYNAGNISADTARLNFNLVNTNTGTIRDSKSIYLGSVGAGSTTSFE